jgi:hypothetical protein
MHPRLALVDRVVGFWVCSTDVEPNLHWWMSFLGNWFDNVYLFVHGDYTR